jgi:uncharacterized protein
MSPIYHFKDYMYKTYSEPLYRIPIDFNLGCPNRNTDGSGGCTFCSESGARAKQTTGHDSISRQLKAAIRFSKSRYKATSFMAYIQAFSATFEPENCQNYMNLIESYPFKAVIIATRPDCLTENAYHFLSTLSTHYDVWVELGVQTVHDKTLQTINRGHNWDVSKKAIIKLNKTGIKVSAHVILGLPGENESHFTQTAIELSMLPLDGIKIHNLHVVKNSELHAQYQDIPFPVFNEIEYGDILMTFLRYLPTTLPIIRASTDTSADTLVAPKWTMNKNQFMEYITYQMQCREWAQGDLLSKRKSHSSPSWHKPVTTDDGSITFWNGDYKEHYHSPAGARLEANEKFVSPSKLANRLKVGPVQVLDICFGLGYNSLCALNKSIEIDGDLNITALEMDKRALRLSTNSLRPLDSDQFNWKKSLNNLLETDSVQLGKNRIDIKWGDARHTINSIPESSIDIIFLDAFSTQRNSELWTLDFFLKLKKVIKPSGVLLTYCAAIPVRSALLQAHFFVGDTKPIGRKRGGTIATLDESLITLPLARNELELIHSSRGIPYRDPTGMWRNKEILRHREESIVTMKNQKR